MTAVLVEIEPKVSPACPACGVTAKQPHYPPSSDGDQGQEPSPWWCRTCLRAKVHAAHGSDCLCDGCAPTLVGAAS